MSRPARWASLAPIPVISDTAHYRVEIHRAPSDRLEDARLQVLIDAAVEQFACVKGCDDGSRSKVLRAVTLHFAALAGASERLAAA